MLVLSTPVAPQLERIGIDSARDNELTLLLEPEVMGEIYALESAAGAQCVVADTAFMTPARLAHAGMKGSADKLADSALRVATEHTPQHVLVEIGPCGLPLDASSKASLNENRDQYARAAATFAPFEPLFDAFFLNGFTSCSDLKCALMGMRKVTDKPILASVDVAPAGEGAAAGALRGAALQPTPQSPLQPPLRPPPPSTLSAAKAARRSPRPSPSWPNTARKSRASRQRLLPTRPPSWPNRLLPRRSFRCWPSWSSPT